MKIQFLIKVKTLSEGRGGRGSLKKLAVNGGRNGFWEKGEKKEGGKTHNVRRLREGRDYQLMMELVIELKELRENPSQGVNLILSSSIY